MTTTTPTAAPGFIDRATFHQLTVAQYHQMIAGGILGEDVPVELIEGYMVTKMPRSTEHDYSLSAVQEEVRARVPAGYCVRGQCATTILNSEPEPDVVVARGALSAYKNRHPGPADAALVIEVSASSLAYDRIDKSRVYARAGIPVYWIVNVIDKQIEVLTDPSGPTDAPAYGTTTTYTAGQQVPLALDGNTVGHIAVGDVFG